MDEDWAPRLVVIASRRKQTNLSRCAAWLRRWLAIEDAVFVEHRLRFYGICVVFALAVALGLGLHRGLWLYRPDGKFAAVDFCWMWFSGVFARIGDLTQLYNHEFYDTAYHNFYGPSNCDLLISRYTYPPTFLFVTYLLGLMPHVLAFAVWVVATLSLYLSVVCLILPGSTTAILALTPFAVPVNISLGHNGSLTAALCGLALFWCERRPCTAGILLGLLTYKPQFGLLFPPALLASRNWRALAGAAAAAFAFGVAAGLILGWRTWPLFIASLFDRTAGLSPQAGVELYLSSVYGLLHRAGAGVTLAWAAQAAVALSLAAVICAVWAKPIAYPLKAAMLATASLLATPYLFSYDLSILAVAVAFLVKDGLARGFLAGERTIIVACFIALYFPFAPTTPIVCVVVLLLIFRRMAAGGGNFSAP